MISLAAARDTAPDTLSTAISDDTAADASDEPSVLIGSSVTDLACPCSKVIEGMKLRVTVKALPLVASLSSMLQMNECSSYEVDDDPSVIEQLLKLRRRGMGVTDSQVRLPANIGRINVVDEGSGTA